MRDSEKFTGKRERQSDRKTETDRQRYRDTYILRERDIQTETKRITETRKTDDIQIDRQSSVQNEIIPDKDKWRK